MTPITDQQQIEALLYTLSQWPKQYEESLPDSNWLQQTINDCFWASLQAEEARPVRVSIIFAHPDEVTQSIRFAEPTARTKADIRRIAAAFDPDISVLASDNEGIWGAALTVPREAVLISITGYGRLLVRRGHHIVASFESGEWTFHRDIDDYIQGFFPYLIDPGLRTFLLEASVSMRRLGHGGALIVTLDANPLDCLEGGVNINGFLNTARTWSQYTSAEVQYESAPTNEELRQLAVRDKEYRDQMRSRLRDVVARLSAIDGAVVLSHTDGDPCVLQFGAKIIVDQAARTTGVKFERVNYPCNNGREFSWDSLEDVGGMRHQSAAHLAALRSNIMILVVSQDGGTSLMGKDKNVVRILSGLEGALPPGTMLRFGSYVRATGVSRGSSRVSGISCPLSSKEQGPE